MKEVKEFNQLSPQAEEDEEIEEDEEVLDDEEEIEEDDDVILDDEGFDDEDDSEDITKNTDLKATDQQTMESKIPHARKQREYFRSKSNYIAYY